VCEWSRENTAAAGISNDNRRPTMSPSRVLETCLYALDLDEAERFYHDVLGLEVYSRMPGRQIFFKCGDGMFLVFNPEATAAVEGRVNGAIIPRHGTSGQGHVAFAVGESEIEYWRSRLGDAGVGVESEVIWPSGGRSIYFRDPAGNSIELAVPSIWGFEEEPP
jgi:catechol 2,3-dioxygenase-like lactoylglutathione lyase family enzyme